MTLGICRRVLHNAHDAEDACQAVFLVLARKAGAVRRKESLASWLHGVALHVALNLKRELGRRAARDAQRPAEPEEDTIADVMRREEQAMIDEEPSAAFRAISSHPWCSATWKVARAMKRPKRCAGPSASSAAGSTGAASCSSGA